MSSTNFGATVVPAATEHEQVKPPTLILDSPALTPSVSHEDFGTPTGERRIPIHSPFYQHPPASFEKVHSRTGSKNDVSRTITEKDLEAGALTPLAPQDETNPFTSKVSVDVNKECRMWPSRQTLMQSRAQEKRRKRDKMACGGCAPIHDFWNRFSKKQKLIIKIALALLLIGVAVAIAVGITAAVNGTVYSSAGSSHQIPDAS